MKRLLRRLLVILAMFAALSLIVADIAEAQRGFNRGRGGRRGGFFRPRPPVVFVQPFPQQRFFAPRRQFFAPPPRHVIVIDQFGRRRIIHNHPPGFGRF